ncbi:MAG: hypothetical protein WBV46_18260, partial [Terriglobales bacterium]
MATATSNFKPRLTAVTNTRAKAEAGAKAKVKVKAKTGKKSAPAAGRFGAYGGRYVPETLMAAVMELERE